LVVYVYWTICVYICEWCREHLTQRLGVHKLDPLATARVEGCIFAGRRQDLRSDGDHCTISIFHVAVGSGRSDRQFWDSNIVVVLQILWKRSSFCFICGAGEEEDVINVDEDEPIQHVAENIIYQSLEHSRGPNGMTKYS
jgi:hypothetical protein